MLNLTRRVFLTRATKTIFARQPLCCFATWRKFTKEHEWVEFDDSNSIATMGLTNHAQGMLGDIVHVEFPDVGSSVDQGDSLCGIESVKTAADVYAPSECEISEINEKVADDPSMVNSEPEGEGWMVKIKVIDIAALDELLDKDAYEKFCEEDDH